MNNKVKWYNDSQMVGALLLFCPPIGVYGLYKSETVPPKWKRVTYGTLVLVGVLLVFSWFTAY